MKKTYRLSILLFTVVALFTLSACGKKQNFSFDKLTNIEIYAYFPSDNIIHQLPETDFSRFISEISKLSYSSKHSNLKTSPEHYALIKYECGLSIKIDWNTTTKTSPEGKIFTSNYHYNYTSFYELLAKFTDKIEIIS